VNSAEIPDKNVVAAGPDAADFVHLPRVAGDVTKRWQPMLHTKTTWKQKIFENQLINLMLHDWAKRAKAASHQASTTFS